MDIEAINEKVAQRLAETWAKEMDPRDWPEWIKERMNG